MSDNAITGLVSVPYNTELLEHCPL